MAVVLCRSQYSTETDCWFARGDGLWRCSAGAMAPAGGAVEVREEAPNGAPEYIWGSRYRLRGVMGSTDARLRFMGSSGVMRGCGVGRGYGAVPACR